MKEVNCPTCGAAVQWQPSNKFKPFCSERCKLIDLGEWASEGYKIPSETKNMEEATHGQEINV